MSRYKKQILLYGNTRNCADIFYFVGASVHDDFFCFTLKGQKCALLSPLEIGRIRRTSKLDRIFDYAQIAKMMPENSSKSYFDAVVWLLKKHKICSLQVPSYFPIGMFDKFLEEGFHIEYVEGQFFQSRAQKKSDELAEIRKANDVASMCFGWFENILKVSKIQRGGKLFYRGNLLTCEYARQGIEQMAISLGADALDTVVACGNQACDPHEVGTGVIKADSLIVVDIFPRLRRSGYFGDMTRTFLKGSPSEAQVKLVKSVRNAQLLALKKIRVGVNGADVHSAVSNYFSKVGFETKIIKGSWGGFFHSTGHGLGLEVHESPSLSTRDCRLKKGNVITVEPGLYYRGIGGCRIEDNVVVETNGATMLSDFHYNWIID